MSSFEGVCEEVPIVYVNDNYGHWNSSRESIISHALDGEFPDLIAPIIPDDDAAFVVKARHSIFFQTPLEYLLQRQGIEKVILTGQVTEQCILYSALDAYIRHFEVMAVRDACASIHRHLGDAAFEMMEINMKATVCQSNAVFR